jgi:crossover junction endodeoxyribonuclease RuvC
LIILGVDPGSHATGYGVIETGPVVRMLGGGVIRCKRQAPLSERLVTIHTELTAVIGQHNPDAMAVEDLFNAKNARSSLILGHARGVILLAGAAAGLPVAEYAPREVKQAVVGKGGAQKDQVQHMVRILLNLSEPLTSDASDALGIAICHAHSRSSVLRLAEAMA